jgi:hypothetical protein
MGFSTSASRVRIILPLLAVWLVAIWVIAYRIHTFGACASVSVTETLQHAMQVSQVRPDKLRLDQPYTQWALALSHTDPAVYIKTGLGFADGKGVSFKDISPEAPNNPSYLPYYFQSPGTPVFIGVIVKLFGEQSVLPYFLVVLTIYFLTAVLACFLASQFIEGDTYIFGAGLLSLLCLPALDYDFGAGLFSSEPLAAPFVAVSLIALTCFWKRIESDSCSFKYSFLAALVFGGSLALAAYFRDIYTTFAQFCIMVLGLVALAKKGKRKQILMFVVVGAIMLAAVEHPWKQRNKHYFGEYTMTGSTYYANAMWLGVWSDYKELAKWGGESGIGLGNYLAPEKSGEVVALLQKDKKAGSIYATRCLIEAVCKRPLDALRFKLGVYDHLWFGQASYPHIYIWCLLSMCTFLVFIALTRFEFLPSLWLFPMFLVCVSPVIQFEPRFSQPFYLFITPIAAMQVLKAFLTKRKPLGGVLKEDELAIR